MASGDASMTDLTVATLATLAAAAAVAVLPAGSVLRLVVTLPILLFAPGYLLLQALLVPARPWAVRRWHVLAALGVSPALVGLLALLTALLPGGMTIAAIQAVVVLTSLALAAAAWSRRMRSPADGGGRDGRPPEPSEGTAPRDT